MVAGQTQLHSSFFSIIRINEIEVFGEPDVKLTPLEAKMSSVYTENGTFPADKCIDGVFKHSGPGNERNLCHTKGGEMYPWIAVNIPRSEVDSVRIYNRYRCPWDNQTSEVYQRTRNITVRVASTLPTTASSPFTEGSLFGEYKGPATQGELIELDDTTQHIVGTWVVLQMEDTKNINLVEIELIG